MPVRKRSRQFGTSLVELMVASTIGVLCLLSIGAMFLSLQGNNSANYKGQILEQTLVTLSRRLENDLTRAGYGQHGSASLLDDATTVVEQQGGGLQYVYWDVHHETPSYQNVAWMYESDPIGRLKICSDRQDSPMTVAAVSIINCEKMVDDKLIEITEFGVTSADMTSSITSKTWIKMVLSGRLANDHSVTRTLQRNIIVRNGT